MRKSNFRSLFLAGTLGLAVGLSGCGGPLWQVPGSSLKGIEAPFETSVVSREVGIIQLETRPDNPYSVNIGAVVIDGQLLIDPADGRRWYQHLQKDPDVRFRFDGDPVIYRARVYPVTDPEILRHFDPDRHVMRLGPRP